MRRCFGKSRYLVFSLMLGALQFMAAPQAWASCTNPSGTTGEIIFNSSHNVFQGCTAASGWVAFHGSGGGGGGGAGGGSATEKIVFVTSTTSEGDLGGIAGGDSTCGSLAASAGLSGTYKAWLAGDENSEDPESNFTQATVPYKLLDGTTIASNWTDLTDGTLSAPINVNELGNTVLSGSVWTHVNGSGTPVTTGFGTNDCEQSANEWASNSWSDDGVVGDFTSTTSAWTNNTTLACDQTARIYCFEQ